MTRELEFGRKANPLMIPLALGAPTPSQVEIIAIEICEEATLNFMHDNSEVVLNCHMKLDQLAENHSITLRWMSSHSEICGKELADELVFNSSTGPEPTCVGCIKA